MRSLEARLRTVEATMHQTCSDAPVLWVFGHDRADLERRLAAEMEAGRLRVRTMAFEVI